jgi:hypothetical protein
MLLGAADAAAAASAAFTTDDDDIDDKQGDHRYDNPLLIHLFATSTTAEVLLYQQNENRNCKLVLDERHSMEIHVNHDRQSVYDNQTLCHVFADDE